MLQFAISAIFAIFLAACTRGGDAPGGSLSVETKQNVTDSQTGPVTQSVGPITSGQGGNGGSASAESKLDLRLALDPAAFTQLFGRIADIKNPTNEQLAKVAAHAANSNNTELRNSAFECLSGKKYCAIVRK